MRAQGKRVALLLYEKADTSTFRYRCYNITQWSQNSDKWHAIYFFLDELETVKQLLSVISLLVMVRVRWVIELDKLAYHARADGIPVLFDTDDYVFDLDALPLVTNTLNVSLACEADYSHWFSYIGRIGFTAARADGFITSNPFLGELLSGKFGKPYRVIRNTLNWEQIAVSERCCEKKRLLLSRCRGQEFVIGYFSGTPSHINDFGQIAVELNRFLEVHSDAKLFVVGFLELPPVMRPAMTRGQVTAMPLTDFLHLQVLMAEVDVSIVPLVNNDFTNCKSELKFFEAGMVHTATIATPTYTYARCIEQGKNGYLCRQGEWYETLQYLYDHPEVADAVAEQAGKDSIIRYAGQKVIAEIEQAYDSFAD